MAICSVKCHAPAGELRGGTDVRGGVLAGCCRHRLFTRAATANLPAIAPYGHRPLALTNPAPHFSIATMSVLREAARTAAPSLARHARCMTSLTTFTPPTLPDLPYDYNALEPVISAEIMTLHHKKHHQAYINSFNAAMDKFLTAEARGDVSTMISLEAALRFNGGGHVNHSIFWTNLTPPSNYKEPSGEVAQMIGKHWGSVDKFVQDFNARAAGVQGSGWCWLGYDKAMGRLVIETTPNQDPLVTKGLIPLLGVDVWEHAYYLQYRNVRPDYLKEIWKVVNWANVNERLAAATK